MSSPSRFTDQGYLNWVKDSLALLYLKEGIEPIVNTEATAFHDGLRQSLGGTVCSSCTAEDVTYKKIWHMKCKLCKPWLEKIVQHHIGQPFPRHIVWGNTSPRQWPTHPWEVLKCYMGFGCQNIRSAADADLQAILTMFKNCPHFTTGSRITRSDLVDELLTIRNSIIHSGNNQINDTQLHDDVTTMLAFLSGMTSLSPDESRAVTNAVDKINELLSNDIELSFKELKLRALQQQMSALEDEQKRLEFDLIAKITKTETTAEDAATTASEAKTIATEADESAKAAVDKIEQLEACVNKLNLSQDQPTNIEIQSQGLQGHVKETECELLRLQSALVQHYKSTQCLLVQNPIIDEALGLEEIYVRPDIKILRESSKPGSGLKNVQDSTPPNSASICTKLFYTEDSKNKQVYVTGNAGVGKTVLSKFLVNLWCDAISESQDGSAKGGKSAEEIPFGSEIQRHELSPDELRAIDDAEDMRKNRQIMSDFQLVFFITLRDSSNDYKIADMIDNQILAHMTRTQPLQAAAILQHYNCLVIIDGLDEWVCPGKEPVPPSVNPGIPGRDLSSNTVCLTTTRPWKLSVLKLKGLEIDKHVELCGLNETSSEELCFKYIDIVNNIEGRTIDAPTFVAMLTENGLNKFDNLPSILILLVGLWFDNQELAQSRVQLFCSMLEMLLKRATEKNLPEQIPNENKMSKGLLPDCFGSRIHCLNHEQLLRNLSKVAFEALLDPKREQSLVLDSDQLGLFDVKQCDIDICLKSGILTQNKVLGNRAGTKKNISFLHKLLQEMLAAVYIANTDNQDHVKTLIRGFCKTAENVLELSQVWTFLSGVRPDPLLSDLLTEVLCKDIKLQQYRQNPMFGETSLSESIQNCIIDCTMEARSNGYDLCLPLFDFVIDKTGLAIGSIEKLLQFNTSTVKSIYIHAASISRSGRQSLARILPQLTTARCLEALYLFDRSNVVTDKSPLCATLSNNERSLTCLEFYRFTLSKELLHAVSSILNHVTVLTLNQVYLTHELRDQLLLSVSQAGNIRKLDLWIHCTHTGTQCKPDIDLSSNPQLQRFYLGHMKVDNLSALAPIVEGVYLESVTISEKQLRKFVLDLTASSHTVNVELVNTTVTGDGANPVDVDLNDLKQNNTLCVKNCHYDKSEEKWTILFSTQQGTN